MRDPFNGKLYRQKHDVTVQAGSNVVTMSYGGASLTLSRGQCMQLASDLLRSASLAEWNASEEERVHQENARADQMNQLLQQQLRAGIAARVVWKRPFGDNCISEQVLLRFVNGRVQQWYNRRRYVSGVETDEDGWGPEENGDSWLGIRRISISGKKTHAVRHDGWAHKPICGAPAYGERWEARTLYEGMVEVTCKRCKAIEAAPPTTEAPDAQPL